MGKSISELEYIMQPRANKALEEMNQSDKLKELGVEKVVVNETRRSLVTQMAYYSRGRMEPKDVKRMYAAAGLYNPSEIECRTCITWTLSSKHIQGLAVDFVPVKDGNPWWNAPKAVWECMGEIGESCGLKWGGRWQEEDLPHFEM